MSNWSGSKKKWPRTVNEARRWIDFDNPDLSIRQQCRLLGLHRSNVYYDPAPESAENLYLMRLMDEEHLRRDTFFLPSGCTVCGNRTQINDGDLPQAI